MALRRAYPGEGDWDPAAALQRRRHAGWHVPTSLLPCAGPLRQQYTARACLYPSPRCLLITLLRPHTPPAAAWRRSSVRCSAP